MASVGAGYLQRNWPTSLKEAGIWPLSGIRQSFLDGSLPRLLNPEQVLTEQIIRFVNQGDFGLAVGQHSDGTFDRVWYKETLGAEEVTFDSQTFLILRDKAQAMTSPGPPKEISAKPQEETVVVIEKESGDHAEAGPVTLRIAGTVPPELWNKLGTRLIPKLRAGNRVELVVTASVEVQSASQKNLVEEVKQILSELGLNWTIEGEN